jgi:hypothetical protein
MTRTDAEPCPVAHIRTRRTLRFAWHPHESERPPGLYTVPEDIARMYIDLGWATEA